jgi:hypothetical protein
VSPVHLRLAGAVEHSTLNVLEPAASYNYTIAVASYALTTMAWTKADE